jgi:hypothetical protein
MQKVTLHIKKKYDSKLFSVNAPYKIAIKALWELDYNDFDFAFIHLSEGDYIYRRHEYYYVKEAAQLSGCLIGGTVNNATDYDPLFNTDITFWTDIEPKSYKELILLAQMFRVRQKEKAALNKNRH